MKNIIIAILEWLMEVFATKEVEDKVLDVLDENKSFIIKKVKDVIGSKVDDESISKIIDHSAQFLQENSKYLLGLSQEQKDYAIALAYLKSIEDLDQLSLMELVEYRKLITKVAEMGPEVARQMNEFSTKFKNFLVAVGQQVANIGVKLIATTIKTAIPFL
jgi:hypothetical protein